LLNSHKMSLPILASQSSNGGHNLEQAVKHTFIHFPDAPRQLRRCNTAPPELMVRDDYFHESADEDIASCTDSSQACFSTCDADSGASTPECFSPRGTQKFVAFPIPHPMPSPIVSPTVPIGYVPVMSLTVNEKLQTQDLFTITLLRAEGVPLGLDFWEDGQSLRVEAVAIHGAVEAWNRQCQVSTRQILPGDEILSVNSAKDPESMRREVNQTRLLKISGRRGPMHFEESYPWVPQFFPVMVLAPGFVPAQPLGSNETSNKEKFALLGPAVHQPQSLEKDVSCHHVWRPDLKKFSGKHTKVTKTELLPLGEFAFMIQAHGVSTERGGSSFQASDGRGTIHVKCNSENLGVRTVVVTMGDESHSVTHNFSTDSICKIPRVFNFKSEGDKKGEIKVAFDFL